ncbi:MAG: YdeI/OmpD-associated family protein [Opitutaceae bacterium]|nr:YdeI/OmpD-associated family protein [Opitutaceae bacterium]
MKPAPRPTFFGGAAAFRAWLDENHATASELWVGFHRKDSGRGGITYPEALDEALCFGWIDGVRKKIAPESYTNRFTPRRSGSIWSNVNLAHVARLTAGGRMHPAGLAAFAARTTARTGVYSFERKLPPELPTELEGEFRAAQAAWKFFGTQPPGYRRLALHYVVSAKRAATRLRRLQRLIADSAQGRRLGILA